MNRALSSPDRRRGGAVLIVGALAFAIGCSSERSLDPERLDALIESAIVDGIGVTPSEIDCPPVTDIDDGTTFTCEVVLDGQMLRMAGVVLDASDGSVEVNNVDAVLFVDLLERVTSDDLTRQLGETITVDCGGGELRIEPVDAQFTCTATDSVGNEAPLVIEVLDADGNISFELG